MGISLKKLVEEIEAELIDEMSVTASAEGYATPNAFAGKKKNWRGGDNGEKSMPKPSERETNLVDEDDPAKLAEGRSKYYNFRDSDDIKKDGSKASFAILEMKKLLKEVDYLMNMVHRFKSEKGITESEYWKRSSADISGIRQTLIGLAKKSRGLK